MTMARHIVALLQSHVAGDVERFLSVATQLAAHEAKVTANSLSSFRS
jgi:hypothetical protein